MPENKQEVMKTVKLLTLDEREALLAPIEEAIGTIQNQINALRVDGADKISSLNEEIKNFKKNKEFDDVSRQKLIQKDRMLLEEAKKVELKNRPAVNKLITKAETYLKVHYGPEYEEKVKTDSLNRKIAVTHEHDALIARLNAEHIQEIARIQGEINVAKNEKDKADKQALLKNENFVYKNRLFDAKLTFQKKLQEAKDEKHEAFLGKYHLIDLLRNSKFTIPQMFSQKRELSVYNFNLKNFLLKNGLYIIIIFVFAAFCIIAPLKEHKDLLTLSNVIQILENSSTRVFFALGVAGLILLAGTDLSIGRQIGLATTITAIFWHNGDNAIHLFGGPTLNFNNWPDFSRVLVSLIICIICCTAFSMLAGFFTAKFKMHPFISTMANMLIIFGLWFYATGGTNSGGVKDSLVNIVTPKIGVFPTLIFWAIACVAVVWFIWNKTKFGKNMYAVGGNAEAASVSGISVFWVTILVFGMAGVLYGIGGWLECSRAFGSASAAYGSGWETDAIAACVVGGISFNGGIGKISGAVAGVVIFTALTYALTFLNIDANIQYVIKGVIILAAVAMDSIKYMKRK